MHNMCLPINVEFHLQSEYHVSTVSTPLLSIDPQATGPKVAWRCYSDKSREAFAGIKGQRSSYYAVVPVKANCYDRKGNSM